MAAGLPRPTRTAPLEAPGFLGRILARRFEDGSVSRVRIVEVEAYEPDDPASHSYRGPTPRNAAMFGPAGHLYVYVAYGVHACMNVTTGPLGHGSAVLLRAAEPLDGLAAMRERRPSVPDADLCRGPGRLAMALGVDRSMNGLDLFEDGRIWLEPGAPLPTASIGTGSRIGIRHGTTHPWRFWERGSRFVSGPRRLSR
ncbi:MAG TPA: DNA-3-methyladenine glycosylase [Actinomycetota bacterium]